MPPAFVSFDDDDNDDDVTLRCGLMAPDLFLDVLLQRNHIIWSVLGLQPETRKFSTGRVHFKLLKKFLYSLLFSVALFD